MRIQIYWNLHRKQWSIRSSQLKRVIGHVDHIVLSDVTARVSERGRKRVMREGRKNVHAYLEGTLERSESLSQDLYRSLTPITGREITYNPYKSGSFTYRDTGEEFRESKIAVLEANRKVTVS